LTFRQGFVGWLFIFSLFVLSETSTCCFEEGAYLLFFGGGSVMNLAGVPRWSCFSRILFSGDGAMSLAGEAGGRARLCYERLCSESPLLIVTAFARGCRWNRVLPSLRQQNQKDVYCKLL
jgi:hypothetical protein